MLQELLEMSHHISVVAQLLQEPDADLLSSVLQGYEGSLIKLTSKQVPPSSSLGISGFGVVGADMEQESWADDPRPFKLRLKALCSFRWSLPLAGDRWGWQGSLRSWKRLPD